MKHPKFITGIIDTSLRNRKRNLLQIANLGEKLLTLVGCALHFKKASLLGILF
jgi:hypothetical protein